MVLVFGSVLGQGHAYFQERTECKVTEESRQVLSLAQNQQPDSRDRLEAIAERESGGRASVLAKGIIERWRDEDMTFRSSRPVVVEPIEFSAEDFEHAVPNLRSISLRQIIVQIHIDEEGCVESIHFLQGGDVEGIKRLVIGHVEEAVFLPAKPEDKFVPGELSMMWRIEIY